MASHLRLSRAGLHALALMVLTLLSFGGCSEGHAEVVRLREACAAGTAADCSTLGGRYRDGHHVLRDEAEAARLFQLACDQRFGDGCASLGLMQLVGRGVKRDTAQARALLARGCEAGAPSGCANLGRLMVRDTGSRRDIGVAVGLLTKACDAADALGCAELGALHRSGDGVRPDPVHARALFERSCRDAATVGCTGLGQLHADGVGTPRNDSIAKTLFTRGCTDDAAACVQLGRFAEEGRAGPVDYQMAARQYRSACQRRDGEGCYRLSLLYETGAGAFRDAERATQARQQACDLGYRKACPPARATP